MFLPKTVVVLKMIPLVLESVEGLVFNFSPRSAPSHDLLRTAPQNKVTIVSKRHSGNLLAGIQKNSLDTAAAAGMTN
jgi:hypothetical protein